MTIRRTAARRATAAVLALAALAPALSACAVLEGPTPPTPKRETPAKPAEKPKLVPGGTAAENLPFFTEVMRDYAAGDGPVEGEPLVEAITAAGFDRAAMQVSFDRTKLDLPADSIYVSVRIGADCLVGQLVAGDRSFVAKDMPAVGPDRTICLIGETRPLQ